MNCIFDKLDYLIYSSHKTSTQTMIMSLRDSKYKTFHIHNLVDFKFVSKNFISTIENVTNNLLLYKNNTNKKLKIISLIRNPTDRILSSFFQSNHDNEIMFKNIKERDTTVMKNSIEYLCEKFLDNIKNKTLPYYYESLYELSDIFEVNIIQNLIKKDNYYYYENNLIQLYVLDFNKINDLDYINKSLNTKITKIIPNNLSINKKYYAKYCEFKNIMKNNKEVIDIIKSYYNDKDINFFYNFS